MSQKWLTALGLAACLFGVTACGGGEDQAGVETTPSSSASAPSDPNGEETVMPEAPEPDVADVPAVVAEVNGQDITREDFLAVYEGQFPRLAMQAQMSGQEVDQDALKQQTAQTMVSTELLVQEAEERDFTVSDQDVETSLEEMATSSGLPSTQEFLAALKEQGMDEQEVRSEVEVQVRVDRLVAQDVKVADPTEKELRELYDSLAAQQGQGGEQVEPPSFREVEPQLKEQVRSQQESEAVQALVDDLRADADVTIHL